MRTTLIVTVLVSGLVLLAGWLTPWRKAASRPSPNVSIQADEDVLRAARAVVEQRLGSKAAPQDGPKTRPDEAARFHRDQRLPIGGDHVPMEQLYGRYRDIQSRDELRLRKGGPTPGGILGWQSIGPGNVGGRTRAIAIHPTNPDIVFAAGVAGGIFRSADAGASWTPVDDFMLNLAVCTLVIDPSNPDIMYAGTGEGYGNNIFVRGLGIFKSTDGGQTFSQLASTSPSQAGGAFDYVNKLVLSPNDSSRLYAATRHGVFRSIDAGLSWDVVLANPFYNATPPTSNGCTLGCLDLAVRTDSNPDVLFAAFGSQQPDGLFRSVDGGDSWLTYSTPSYQGRMTITISPADNDRIYLAMADNGGLSGFGRIAGLFRSDDGTNFTYVQDPDHKFTPWLFSYSSIALGCLTGYPIYSQGWYDQIIAADPVDPDVLFLGGIDQFRSDDAGATFGMSGYLFFRELADGRYVHVDQHAIVFHPGYDGVTNQTMYVGNDGGVWRTENARAATTQEECPIAATPGPPPDIQWQNLNNGYAVTQFYHGDSARDTDLFVAGAQDNSVQRVNSRSTPNSWEEILGGDGGYVAIDHTNSQIIYTEIQGFPTIEKSIDGGDTFADAVNGITDTDGLFITPFAMDPSDPSVLWTGGTRPWRTVDGAGLWTLAGTDFPGAHQISAIAIAPGDGNVVYMGFNNGYVARTTDGLSGSPTWTVFSAGLPLGGWVSSVAVDPVDSDVAYATYTNVGIPHIFKTSNGGSTWVSIDGVAATGVPDIPVHWIAVRPTNSAQLYAGTEFGVFASDDGGATWLPGNDGLAHTVVEALDFKDDDTLVAFTFGRGTFVTSLASPTGAPLAASGSPSLLLGRTPFVGSGTLRLKLPAPGPVRLSIYDVRGQRVRQLSQGHFEAGQSTVTWDGRDDRGTQVAAGNYFARLEAGGHSVTEKVVLVR